MTALKILHKVLLRAARVRGQVYVKDGRIWQKGGGCGVPTIQATPIGRELIAWGYLVEDPAGTGYVVPTPVGEAWLDADSQRDNSVQHRSHR